MAARADLADRAEASPLLREARHALADGARWGWAVVLVAAIAVWVARGLPSPRTAAAAALLLPVAVALVWWRAWRLTARDTAAERRAAASASARRWATGLGLIAALVPGAWLAAGRPLLGAIVALVVVAALAELAILTIPARARARLMERLRIAARAVARDEDVRVHRPRWRPRTLELDRVLITYPPDWTVHTPARRDELVSRMMWEIVGPAPRSFAEAVDRPEYLSTWAHVDRRLVVERVPALPRLLNAQTWPGRPDGVLVLGQTLVEHADVVLDGRPLALWRPERHTLIVGATQFGKSSGVRAWVTDGLVNGVFPGGLLAVLDGKGSGSFVALEGRVGVGPIAVKVEQWTHALEEVVMPVVDTRYEALLKYRRGDGPKPRLPLAVVIVDEIQQIVASNPALLKSFDRLARQALEAGVLLWVLTQRPDSKDTIPGAMKDQLDERVTFGPLSSVGARMVFGGDDWHRAMGVRPIQGRCLTWMGGTWRPIQVPWLPFPVDVPAVESLHPTKSATQPVPRPATNSSTGPSAAAGKPAPSPRPDASAGGTGAPKSPPVDADDPYGYGTPPPPAPSSRPSPSTPTGPEGTGEYDPGAARRRRRRPQD